MHKQTEVRNLHYDVQARGSPESEYSEPIEYAASLKDKFCPPEHVSDSLSFLRCMRRRLENLSRRIPADKAAAAGRLETQKATAKSAAAGASVEGSGDLFSVAQNPAVREGEEQDQLRVAQEEIETVLRTSLIGLRQASRLIKGTADARSNQQPIFSRQKPQDTKVTDAICGCKRKQLDDLYELPSSRVCESPAKRSALPSRGLEEPSSSPVDLEAIAEGLQVLLNGLREDKRMVCSSVQTSNSVSNKAAYTSPPSPPPSCQRLERRSDYSNTDPTSTSSASGEFVDLRSTALLNQPNDWCYSDRRLSGPQPLQFSPKPLPSGGSNSKSDVFRMLTTIERSLELLAADVRQENSEIVDMINRSLAKSRALEKERIHHHHTQHQEQPLPTRDQVFELKQAVEDLIYKVLFKRRKLKRLLRLQLKDRTADPSSTTADYPSTSQDSSSSVVDSASLFRAPPPPKPSLHRRQKSPCSHASKKEASSCAEKSSVKHRQKMKGGSGEDAKYEMLMALKVLRRDFDRLINSLAVDKKRSSVRLPLVYGRVVRDDIDDDV